MPAMWVDNLDKQLALYFFVIVMDVTNITET